MSTAIIIFLCLVIVALSAIHIKKKRHYLRALQVKEEWLSLFNRTLDGLRSVIENIRQRPDWISQFCSLAMHEFEADGAMVYYHPGDDHDVTRVRFLGGLCRNWNIALSTETYRGPRGQVPTADSRRTKVYFEPDIPSDFYWTRQPNIYSGTDIDPWLPPIIDVDIQSALIAPMKSDRGEAYLLLLRKVDRPEFTHDDQERLGHCVSIAEAGFTALQAEHERQNMEQELQTAHEEGMLQISTGIIHNIGNGITVIQLALERLREGDLDSIGELASFIDSDILPVMQQKMDAGQLQEFLTHDPQGQEYMGALQTLIHQVPGIIADNKQNVEFIGEKFRNITEIITLQQQFIGELGTENVCLVNAIVSDAITICTETLSQNNIKLFESLQAKDRILVDSAMMRHMILLLMKYAIEAAAASRRSEPIVKVETSQEVREEKGEQTFVTCTIFDNGAGRDVLPDDEDLMIDRRNIDEQTRNLVFIKRRISKYGGIFELESEFGMGTRISLHIPSFESKEKTTASKQ